MREKGVGLEVSGTDTPGALGGETSGKSRRWPGRSWGMSRAGGAAGRARRALGVWGWSGEDLGLEEGGAAHERSPRLSRSLGEREPAGEGAGSWGGPARWAGLVWVSRHLFFSSLFCCLPAPSITDGSSCDNLLLDFGPHCPACGILVPPAAMEPALGDGVITTGPPGKSLPVRCEACAVTAP